jgi:hypothetical protein
MFYGGMISSWYVNHVVVLCFHCPIVLFWYDGKNDLQPRKGLNFPTF